jgi:hypothetical protein
MNPLKKIIKYPNRLSNAQSKLAPAMQDKLEKLRTDGSLVLPATIAPDRLALIQAIYHEELEGRCRFETPCLGQNLISDVAHKHLIDNHFLCSKKELEENRLTFRLTEGDSYSETIARFNPSTIKVYVSQIQELFIDWLNEEVLALIEAYMGVKPYLTEAYIRRNFPARYKVMNHFWHRDVNQPDYILKAFIFLSDCALENGPHEFVLGSVNSPQFPGGDYFSDAEIDAAFPPGGDKRLRSVVKAGTIILEDTSGLHRAMVPERGYRDLGYAVFVPRPFYASRQKPLYTMSETIYNRLNAYQQQFVPVENIA